MDAILRIALGTKFAAENIDAVLQVINATPDPEIATEILLGIYVDPMLTMSLTCKCQGTNEVGIRTFISYDKFSKKVKYSYEYYNNTQYYFPEGMDIKSIQTVLEAKASGGVTGDSMTYAQRNEWKNTKYVKNDVLSTNDTSTSLEDWTKYAIKD